jgi:V8-like Glu-specific endopeptidase
MIKGIGRLNLTDHPSLRFGGTAFVVAQDLFMTNRHVAEFFVNGAPGTTLEFKPGISSSIDLKEEVDSVQPVAVRVTNAVFLSAHWDAALLRVASLPDGVRPLPLAAARPASIDSRVVIVIGYPAMDPGGDAIQQIKIFRGVFDKKRLTPGRLMGFRTTKSFGKLVNALAHDCTTLGGNSGSAVIDVNLGAVVGLHFEGDQFVANYSVPVWELASDPLVASAGVQFV